MQAIAFENMVEGVAGRSRFAAAARILSHFNLDVMEVAKLKLTSV